MNVKDFRAFDWSSADNELVRDMTLLYVFARGNSALFVTKDDNVFGVGHNRSGCLALGHFKDYRRAQPSLLTGQQIVDIFAGFEHCIGLTASGKCLAWGQNKYGQLGIGSHDPTPIPRLIEELDDLQVVQISCGAYFSLALTSDGEVFSWGHNTFAQLGDKTYNSRNRPTQVMINETITSISCATNNSLALTSGGRIYIWGNNTCGQLGRDPERDQRGREKPMCNRPSPVSGLDNLQITKAVCGANHVLLLTSEGDVYAFGENSYGQIGNGSTDHQFSPIKVKIDVKLKDIISHYDNDMSIGVSENDKFFVWGSDQMFLRPQVIPDGGKCSFAVYLKYARNKITYKSVRITDGMVLEVNQTKNSVNEVMNNMSNQKISSKEIKIQPIFISNHKQLNARPVDQSILTTNVSISELRSEDMSQHSFQSVAGQVFLRHLRKSFNNPNDFDLKITSGDKSFHCRRSVISIRNKMFAEVLNKHLSENKSNQMEINDNSFDAFFAFIQYMYGIEPQIELKFLDIIQNMAKLFEEPELEDICAQLQPPIIETIDDSNICSLYEKAITEGLKDLENSCVEFAANNWKNVCKSDAFQELDDKLSKRLLTSVIKL